MASICPECGHVGYRHRGDGCPSCRRLVLRRGHGEICELTADDVWQLRAFDATLPKCNVCDRTLWPGHLQRDDDGQLTCGILLEALASSR